MKIQKVFPLLLLCLFTSDVFAKSLPALEGQIHNYSSHPTTSIEIKASFMCRERDFMGWRHSCGNDYKTLVPQADGRFSIPEMTVPSVFGGEYEVRINFSLQGTKGHVYEEFSLVDRELKKYDELKNISIFEIAKQTLNFTTQSGRSSEDWVKNEGQNAHFELTMSFTGEKIEEYLDWHLARLNASPTDTNGVNQILKQFIIVPGQYSADTPVYFEAHVKAPWKSRATIGSATFKGPFSSILPEAISSLLVEENTSYVKPVISDTWAFTINQHNGYRPNIPDGFYDAEATLLCQNGQLSGKLRAVSRGGSEIKFDGHVDVSGTCSDENSSGQIVLHVQDQWGDNTSQLTFNYDDISERSLYTSELDKFEELHPDKKVLSLKLKNPSGQIIGDVHAERGKNIYLPR